MLGDASNTANDAAAAAAAAATTSKKQRSKARARNDNVREVKLAPDAGQTLALTATSRLLYVLSTRRGADHHPLLAVRRYDIDDATLTGVWQYDMSLDAFVQLPLPTNTEPPRNNNNNNTNDKKHTNNNKHNNNNDDDNDDDVEDKTVDQEAEEEKPPLKHCLLYTSPSPRD